MTEAPYPPAETPADDDRTNQVQSPPRFSASASVPVPPPNSPPAGPASFSSAQGPGGATYGGMPGSPFSHGSPYGQPPPPPPPPSPAPPPPPPAASGQARVTASASVPPPAPNTYGAPQAPTTYGSAPQGYPAQSGVYGQPGGAQFEPPGGLFGQPPAPGSPPAPAGQGGFGAPPSYAPPPLPPPSGAGGGYGAGVYGQSAQREPQMQPQVQPPGEWTGSDPGERKPRRGLIIALIAAAVVVVVAVGGYVGFRMMQGGSTYTVGTCVQQQGTGAAVVDCTTSGAFRITSIVDGENTCPDANQPSLVLTDVGGGKKYACLAPASSS